MIVDLVVDIFLDERLTSWWWTKAISGDPRLIPDIPTFVKEASTTTERELVSIYNYERTVESEQQETDGRIVATVKTWLFPASCVAHIWGPSTFVCVSSG